MADDTLFDDIGKFLREEKPDESEYILFTEEEYDKLILAFVTAAGEEGITEEEIFEAVRCCEKIRAGQTILELFFKDMLDISWKNGDIFAKLSEYGREAWEAGQ